MRVLGILLLMGVGIYLICTGSAQEKTATNKEKIIGIWELAKVTPADDPWPKMWDFTKDEKVKLTLKMGDKQVIYEAGTYEVDGDTIKFKIKLKAETLTWKIKTLADTTLVLEAKKDDLKATLEFKKK